MSQRILDALLDVQKQGESLLLDLTDDIYANPFPEAEGASIGAHYRHHLEHVDAWLNPDDYDIIDYDARQRDRRLETDRSAALERTRKQMEACRHIAPDHLQRAAAVRCRVSYEQNEKESALTPSSVGREAMNVIVHGIHHYALMAILCRLHGIRIPEGFGVAPSTARHRHELAQPVSSTGGEQVDVHC